MGTDPRRWAEIRPFAEKFVSVKAKQIIGKAGLRRSDLEDIRQFLLTHLVEHLDEYDPERGSLEAHATMLATTAVKLLLRERRAQKRGSGRLPASLDAPAHDERPNAGVSLADYGRRLGLAPRDERADADRAVAMSEAMASLPPALIDTARRLASGETEASIARGPGRSRRSVAREVAAIRAHLERHGLDPS